MPFNLIWCGRALSYSFLIGRILYIYFSGATAKVGDPASIAFFSNFLRNIEPDWLNSRFFDFFHLLQLRYVTIVTNTNLIVKVLEKVALENKVVSVGTNLRYFG